MNWGKFLEVLPSIATQPLAIMAYVMVVGAWLLYVLRRIRSRDFLKALESLNESDRPEFCRRAGYSYDDLAALSKGDRMKALTMRNLLVAYVGSLVGIIVLVGLIVYSLRG